MRTATFNLVNDVVRISDAVPLAAPLRPAPQRPVVYHEDDGPVRIAELPTEVETAPAAYEAETGYGPVGEEIIKNASAEAARMVQQALNEAQLQKEAVLEQARQEAETLREQAVQQGRRQGYSEMVDTVRQAAAGLEGAMARLEGERAGFEMELEHQLAWMAAEVAGKVLAQKVQEDDTLLVQMVQKAVNALRDEPWIRVEVAQEMGRLIDALNGLLAGRANVEVSAIPAPAGTIQLESPSGVVDVSLQTQLENLKTYLAQQAWECP